MNPFATIRITGVTLALCLACSSAPAQQPPSLGYAWPPVVEAGKTNERVFGGYDFTADLQFFVHHEGIHLTQHGTPGEFLVQSPPYWFGQRASSPALPIPREIRVTLDVAADCPEGLVAWQVANANGGSATAMLYISHGAETTEQRSRDFPQALPTLPIGVSGRLENVSEVDRYTFQSARDGLVTLDLMARRLGAAFHAAVEVYDDAGTLVADHADTQGVDLQLTFPVQTGREYTIHVHDVEYRGHRGFVYRMGVRPGPRVVTSLPASVSAGRPTTVTFIGYGLASRQPMLESVESEVQPLAESDSFLPHPLSTAAGDTLYRVPVSTIPDVVRPDAETMPLAAPQGVTALFDDATAEHRYTWEAGQGEHFALSAQSRAIGGALDVALRVLGPGGNLLVENDDLPGTTDAGFQFQTPQEGTYTATVRDLSGRSPRLDSVYRLELSSIAPDFELTLPQLVNLPLAGSAEIPIKIERRGGFTGEIDLVVNGLPDGVTVDGESKIPGDAAEFKLKLTCSDQAAVVASLIHIHGTAEIDGEPSSLQATAPLNGNLCPVDPKRMRTVSILLAMTMTPPFQLELVDRNRQRDVHRGTTYPAEFRIVRDEGFFGPLQIQMAAQQGRHRQGIRGPVIPVAANEQTALYPCFMPEWLSTAITRRMVVIGVAPVTDPAGNVRELTRLANARITMILEGALLKVAADERMREFRPGDSIEIPFTLLRSPKLPLEATVELVIPDELHGILTGDVVTLAPDVGEGIIRAQTTPDESLSGLWTLTLRATALQENRWPAVSETPVRVAFSSE